MITPEDVEYGERVVCLGNRANKHVTVELAARAIAENIPGDFAECGVLSGGHPALMAWAIKTRGGVGRRVHLYDSFQGVPMAGPRDTQHYKDVMGVNPDPDKGIACGRCVGTRQQVESNLRTWDVAESILVYHEGWLQEILPVEDLPQLALLRVDVDLYDSTVPIFRHLYPQMASGAFVISDDWGEGPTAPCRLAVIETIGYEPDVTPVEGQVTTVWWRKP